MSKTRADDSRARRPVSQITEDQRLDQIFPHKIPCQLRTVFDKEPKEPYDFHSWAWTDPESYETLSKEIAVKRKKITTELKSQENVNIEVYHRHGSCRVVGLKHEGPFSVLEDYEAVSLQQTTIRNVCGFLHQYPFEPFHVEIFIQFSSFEKWLNSSHTDVQRMIRTQIQNKMEENNFNNQEFLPRIDRNQLTSRDILLAILEQEHGGRRPLEHNPSKTCDDIVTRGASNLFFASIYKSIDVPDILHMIFHHEYNDENLSKPEQHNQTCQNKNCSTSQIQSRSFQRILNAFFARKIERDGKQHQLKSFEVMPIMNIPNEGEKDTILGSD